MPHFSNELEITLGIEALHDDDGAAVADRQVDGRLRRRMIERRGRQVDHAFAVMPELLQEIEQRQLLCRAARPAAGARCPSAGRWCPTNRASRCRCSRRRSASLGRPAVACLQPDDAIAFAFAIGDDAKLDLGAFLQRLARDVELRFRGDENARLAVGEDVGELGRGQVGIHAGKIQAAPFAGAAGFEVAAVVLHEDRIVIEPLQAAVAKQMRQPIAAGLQLAIGHRLAGARHDKGGLKRTKSSMLAGVHLGFDLPTRPCQEFRGPAPVPRSCAGCAAPRASPSPVARCGRNARDLL